MSEEAREGVGGGVIFPEFLQRLRIRVAGCCASNQFSCSVKMVHHKLSSTTPTLPRPPTTAYEGGRMRERYAHSVLLSKLLLQ